MKQAGFESLEELDQDALSFCLKVTPIQDFDHSEGHSYYAYCLDKIPTVDQNRLLNYLKNWETLDSEKISTVSNISSVDGTIYFVESFESEINTKAPNAQPTFSAALKSLLECVQTLKMLHQAKIPVVPFHQESIGFRKDQITNPIIRPGSWLLLEFGEFSVDNYRFCPPEMVAGLGTGDQINPCLYSLGIHFFEIMTGHQLFSGRDLKSISTKIYSDTPPGIDFFRGDCPPFLSEIAKRLIRKNDSRRYHTFEGLLFDLNQSLKKSEFTSKTAFALGRKDSYRELNYSIPIVGRVNEIAVLEKGWYDTLDERGTMQIIGAPSGTGKTRLAREIQQKAEKAKSVVLDMKFSTYESNVPLSAVNRALGHYVEELQHLSPDLLRKWKRRVNEELDDFGYLLNQRLTFFGDLLPKFKKHHKLDRDLEEQKFYETFAQFFTLLSWEDHPTFIFVDDLQWADSVSINLFGKIAELAKQKKMRSTFVLGAYRSEEVPLDSQLKSDILDIIPFQNLILLDGLSVEESNELVSRLIDEDSEEVVKLQKFTFSLTNGRPFFVYEFLENAINKLYHKNDEGHWVFAEDNAHQQYFHQDLNELAKVRIANLRPDTMLTLLGASVVGAAVKRDALVFMLKDLARIRPFDSKESIASIIQRSVHELRLEHMIQKSENPIIFFHDRIRDAAWSLVPEAEKPFLHQSFARYYFNKILNDKVDIDDSLIFEIAFHVVEGGIDFDLIRSIRVLSIAAKKSMDLFSYRQARDYLKVIAERFPLNPDSHLYTSIGMKPSEVIDMFELYGDALTFSEDVYGGLRIYHEILNHVKDGIQRAEILKKVSTNNLFIFDYYEAIRASDQCLASLRFSICKTEINAILTFPYHLMVFCFCLILSLFYKYPKNKKISREQQLLLDVMVAMLVPSYFTKPLCAITNVLKFSPKVIFYRSHPMKAILSSYGGVVCAAFGLYGLGRRFYDNAHQYFENDPHPVSEIFLNMTRSYLIEYPSGNLRTARSLAKKAIADAKKIGEVFWRALAYQAEVHLAYVSGTLPVEKYAKCLYDDFKKYHFGATMLQCLYRYARLSENEELLKEIIRLCEEQRLIQKEKGFATIDGVYANISAGELYLINGELKKAEEYLSRAQKMVLRHFHRVAYCNYSAVLLAMARVRQKKLFRSCFSLGYAWINVLLGVKVYTAQTLFCTGEFYWQLGIRSLGIYFMRKGILYCEKRSFKGYENELRLQLATYLRSDDEDLAETHFRRASRFYRYTDQSLFYNRAEGGLANLSHFEERVGNQSAVKSDMKAKLNMQAIIEMFLNIAAVENTVKLAEEALKSFELSTGADHGIFCTYDESGRLQPLYCFGVTESFRQLLPDFKGDSLVHARRYWDINQIIMSFEQEGINEPIQLEGYGESVAGLAVPLFNDQKIQGIVVLGHRKIPRLFVDQDLDIVKPLAIQSAIGINNFHLWETIQDLNKRLSEHLESTEAEVRSKTRDIQSIFSSIEMAVIAVDRQYRIHSSFSKYSKTIFPHIIANESFIDTVFRGVDEEQRSYIDTVLRLSLDNDVLGFDSNSSLLPKDLCIQVGESPRDLSLSWAPIIDENDVVEKILFVARDVTEIKMLREAKKAQDDYVKVLAELLQSNAKSVTRILTDTSELLSAMKSTYSNEHASKTAIDLHTLKGNARSLGLTELATMLHQLESVFTKDKDTDFVESWHLVVESLTIYREIVDKVLQFANNKDSDSPNPSVLSNIETILKNRENQDLSVVIGLIEDELTNVVSKGIKDIVEELEYLVQNTAGILGKPVPVLEFSGPNFPLSEEEVNLVRSVLVHLMNNALDHGLEHKDERIIENKSPEGHIYITAVENQEDLIIEVKDDGRGLNIDAIKGKAEESSIVFAKDITDEELCQLIFLPSFSTKSESSIVSGRGVGLEAVKTMLESCGHGVELILMEQQVNGNISFIIRICLKNMASSNGAA